MPPSHLRKLDDYLAQGGNIFLAYANVMGDLQNSALQPANDIGLASWVNTKGVTMGNQFLVDAKCASVTVQQRSGYFTINNQVQFPYFPQISSFEDHPISSGLEGILLPFTNALSINSADTSLRITPLAFTSEKSGLQATPTYIDVQKKWTERDFTAPNQILALSIEGTGNAGSMVLTI